MSRIAFNGFTSAAQARRALRDAGFNIHSLLTAPESNPKVAKNGKVGVLSAPLHLSPFNLSGFQVCPQASAGCAAACLHTAGNPAYMDQKEVSRKTKTLAYFKAREAFMALLSFEIAALARKAVSLGMTPGVRLNATSDLPWEVRTVTVQVGDDEPREFKLMDWFNAVEFYDYTKVTKRALAWAQGRMPSNYHLTFSRTEDNDDAVAKVLCAGGNVAIVMSKERYARALEVGSVRMFAHERFTAIDGDEHDFRPVDPKGCIVALKAKGDAKHDTSGFVLR